MRQIRITLPQKKIKDFCLKWKISEMALFGSVLLDEFRSDSDIDVLVSFKDDAGWGLFDFVDMIDELKAIFGRKVDLVEKDSLRNPFRRQTKYFWSPPSLTSLRRMINYAVTALIILPFAAAILSTDEPNAPEPNKPPQSKPQEIPTVDTIVNKANLVAYYQGDDGRAKVKMTIINKQGQKREREFIILRKDVKDGGDQKYFVYFDRPPDVRKMAYLVHKHAALDKDDDRWLYLPALSLVKRIAAGDKRTSFVGSHFLYEDVSGRSLAEDSHELTDVTDEFFVVKNVPNKPDTVQFSHYNVFIDRETYMPVKIEYFDNNDKLYRTIEAKKIEKIQGFPTPVLSEVSDSKTGGKTIMEYSEVKYDIGLGEIFKERYLSRPPREATR